MAFSDRLTTQSVKPSISPTSGFSSRLGGSRTTNPILKPELDTLEGLRAYAEATGVDAEIKKPKLSFLQRLSKGLSAFNPAEAFLTAKEKGTKQGVLTYPKTVLQGIGSAITGTDYDKNRRGFREVAEKYGVENRWAKFGLGFAGDVLLDPSTYFGGAILKGLGFTAKVGGKLAMKGVAKIAPATDDALRIVAGGIQDALGKAFKFGYKTSKGASDDVLTHLSSVQRAKLGLASDNLDRLGTGILTKAQREELALKLIAGKRAEFIAREAGKSVDEAGEIAKSVALKDTSTKVSEVIGKQLERSKQFADDLNLENPYEVYFPFIKKDKLAKFLNESRGIRVGSEGYRKQFKNLMTNESMELDPAKAFFTRESQIVSDKMTRDFLNDFVGKYGKSLKEFKTSDDALKEGLHLIKEKGVFGKPVGYVNEWDAKLIRDGITPEFQTINMLAKATGFDAVTSLFKRSVTGLFAPFHIRNFVSGQIQNFETLGIGALNPKNIAIGQKIAYLMGKNKKFPTNLVTLGKQTMKFDELMEPFAARFSGDTFYNADFDMALKGGAKEIMQGAKTLSKARLKETIKTAGLGQEGIPFKMARGIGQFIEHQQKATAYVTALGQGKTIQQALSLAEKAGFDYRALTRFESQIMRRLIPFYSFTRKNIELQLRTLGENPQRINQILSFFENIGDLPTDEEKKNLPEFIQEAIGVKLEDTPDGLKQYISTFGTPIEAFTQLFGSNQVLRTMSTFNPLLKVPVEIGIGKDSFRKRDLKDVYDAREYKLAPQIIKDLLEIHEVEKPIYKEKNGKLIKVGTRIQYVADPERLLIARSLFTSRGVTYLDQLFGNDLQGFAKFLKTTTGIKPQQVDIEREKYFNEKEQMDEIESRLIREGKLKEFSNTYIPKD